jgi:hypothetical protein
MRQLKVGHKIKWNLKIGSHKIYTVLAIDVNHEPTVITTPRNIIVFDSQILLQWQESNGSLNQLWSYNLDDINESIAKGQISILNPEIEPCQHLPRFSFNN